MIRSFQYKLYPNAEQRRTLDSWLSVCCWLYNQSLEMRIKAYKRRGVSVTYKGQQALLTKLRERIDSLRRLPVDFERDALRRVDRGFKAFFRRLKAGQKPGYPRFRSWHRYNSLEYLAVRPHLKDERIWVPKIGAIRCRGRKLPDGTQRALRILRRPSGWYAQILIDDGRKPADKRAVESAVGIDVGLSSFATLSDGSTIDNPRWRSKSTRKLRALQRRVSRRKKGSSRSRRAINSLARRHDVVALQRRNFCHQHSTALVGKYDLIAVENLNVNGMVRSRFGKSINDAAWSTFTSQLVVKAECAGRQVVLVNPRGTSQECPDCGAVKPKKLSERVHRCDCGCEMDRDHAAAQIILARGLVATGSTRPLRDSAAGDAPVAQDQADPLKRVNIKSYCQAQR